MLLTYWAIWSLPVGRSNKDNSVESWNGEKQNKLGVVEIFWKGLVSVKKEHI